MVSSLKLKHLVIAVLALGACFALGRFTGPSKVETKEVEKIVYRERVVKDVTRTTKETRLPDGTVIRETDTRRKTDTKKDVESDKLSESKTTNRPAWRLGVTYVPVIPAFQEMDYAIRIERQLFSELYLGIEARSQRSVGLTLSIGF